MASPGCSQVGVDRIRILNLNLKETKHSLSQPGTMFAYEQGRCQHRKKNTQLTSLSAGLTQEANNRLTEICAGLFVRNSKVSSLPGKYMG